MLGIRSFLAELHAWEWVGILIARLAVGLLFFLSGRAKLFVPERREQMRQTLIEAHVPFPDFNAAFVSTVEFVCGLLLVLGAVTPLACAMLACVMVLAIETTAIRNIKASSPTDWLAAFLYLPEPLYLVILIWLYSSQDPDGLALISCFWRKHASNVAGVAECIESLKKRFFVGTQIDFQAPCAAVLLNKIPIRFGNGFRLEQRFFSGRFVSFAHLWRVDHAVDNDARNMIAFGPKLDCKRLRQAAHCEFRAAECHGAAAPAHRRSCAGKDDRAPAALEHVEHGFARTQECATNTDSP
jgi:putative oxidoreductase